MQRVFGLALGYEDLMTTTTCGAIRSGVALGKDSEGEQRRARKIAASPGGKSTPTVWS